MMTYPRPLRMVHWTIAILVTCQLAIAVVLTQLRSLAYGQLVLSLHRQLGLVILLLVIARFVFIRRQRNSTDFNGAFPTWQTRIAALVHGAFYVVLAAQPVMGIFLAWARGDAIGLFGLIQIASPVEISDNLREQLMTAHAVTAGALFCMCLLHVGAVVFNRVVRRVSVIDRMLEPVAQDKLVNRVPIAAQLALAFGIVISIALLVGINAVATYRELSRASAEFQAGDLAVADQLRAAQVAWKDAALALGNTSADPASQLKDLVDSARSSLQDAQTHAQADVKAGLTEVLSQLDGAAGASGPAQVAAFKDVDAKLQELVDSQSIATLQHRTDNDERGAKGHDLIVITVLPMLLAALMTALLLARSISGALTRMRGLIQSIEADRRDGAMEVEGNGEIASLTRAIIAMRGAVEGRANAAAARQTELEVERARSAKEQHQREIEAASEQRLARQAQREQLAAEFELQVAGIVATVAETAQSLSSNAASMAASASTASQRSRQASGVAERTSHMSSQIAEGSGELSGTARSVRENAEQSKSRAGSAVTEVAQAQEQIGHLVASARQISGITTLIANVARQTNLLAINARIEAARAGEVGRGFSIVADEVKALATQTRDATAGIEKQIGEVSVAAARSSESLERLSDVIAGVDQATVAIFAATDAQFASTTQLSDRVSEISSSMRSVADDIRGAQETAQATERLSADVVGAAAVIDEQAEQLRNRIGQFVAQLRNAGASGAPAVPGHASAARKNTARTEEPEYRLAAGAR